MKSRIQRKYLYVAWTLIDLIFMTAMLISCANSDVDSLVSQEIFGASVVLAYGAGRPSYEIFSYDPFKELTIPELVAYDNGLVLFACRDETWSHICQNYVSSGRINSLLDDITAAGFFALSKTNYPGTTGPHSKNTIMVRVAEVSRTVHFGGNASFSEDEQNITLVRKLLDEFYNEVQVDHQFYVPQSVIFGVNAICDCHSMTEQIVNTCQFCEDSHSWIDWPFEFVPPYSTMAVRKCRLNFEMVHPITVLSALPDFEESEDWNYKFRDGDIILSVKLRSQLPGETIVQCSEERVKHHYPLYLFHNVSFD